MSTYSYRILIFMHILRALQKKGTLTKNFGCVEDPSATPCSGWPASLNKGGGERNYEKICSYLNENRSIVHQLIDTYLSRSIMNGISRCTYGERLYGEGLAYIYKDR